MADNSLRNKAFKYIKTQVLNGKYKQGETLIESKMAKELGVSRTPIREALQLLEIEGLVETCPNKGTVVLGISTQDVRDIFTIRCLIEGLAARWAAERMTAEQKNELRKAVDLMEFYAAKGEMNELTELDNHFHQQIYDASGSKILKITLGNLHQFVQLARLESLMVPHRLEDTLREHRAIFTALMEGNPENAEKAMANHVNKASLNIIHAHPNGLPNDNPHEL
jgi:DNA-binding GntR family transcriptional regulator